MSLIMAVWRPREDWLRAAVGSALAQRDCDLELVVVDDGCEHPVAELLADVHDTRLRVQRVPHGGVSAARNAGLEAASGEWIRYVDGDDVLVADSTARLLRLTRGEADVVAYGATTFCDEELRPLWTMRSRLQGRIAVDCLLGRFTVRLPALLFPRRAVETAGGWEPRFRVSGDWDFVLRVLDIARVRGETAVALLYRRHPRGLTGNLDAGREGARLVVERYLQRHPEARGTALERRARGMLHALSARVALTRGDRGLFMREVASALRTNPIAVADEIRRSAPALPAQLRRRRPPT